MAWIVFQSEAGEELGFGGLHFKRPFSVGDLRTMIFRTASLSLRRVFLAGTALGAGFLVGLSGDGTGAKAQTAVITPSTSEDGSIDATVTVTGSGSNKPSVVVTHAPGPADAASDIAGVRGNITLRMGNGSDAAAFGPVLALAGTYSGTSPRTGIDPDLANPKSAPANVSIVLRGNATASADLSWVDVKNASANQKNLMLGALTAGSAAGTVTVENNGTVTATNAATGVLVFGGSEKVTVKGSGAITTDGEAGIDASSISGAVEISYTGPIRATGGGEAVFAHSKTGSVTVSLDAAPGTSLGRTIIADGYTAVSARSASGDVTVRGSADIESGDAEVLREPTGTIRNAIDASTSTGSVLVSGSGSVIAKETGAAIRAAVDRIDADTLDRSLVASDVPSGDVTITRSGTITSLLGRGIDASNAGTGDIVIAGIGAVTATTGEAISAAATGGGDVTIGSANVGGLDARISNAVLGSTGISVSATGEGNISIATKAGGTVTGTASEGIKTSAEDGLTTIDIGADVSGVTHGVTASGAGGVRITGPGRVTASNGNAISVGGLVEQPQTPARGQNSQALVTPSTNVEIYAIGIVEATNGVGILVDSSAEQGLWPQDQDPPHGGNVFIGARAGAASDDERTAAKLSNSVSGVAGIVANTNGSGAITIATKTGGTVTGTGGAGIFTEAADGTTTIDIGAAVSGVTDGLSAAARGAGAITITSNARIASTASEDEFSDPFFAINATSGSGNILVGTSQAAIRGAVTGPNGIYAASTGNIAITTGTGGTVTGTQFSGIQTYSGFALIDGNLVGSGTMTIDAGADVRGAEVGIVTKAATGATSVTIRTGAKVSGGSYALYFGSWSGAVEVSNAGRIEGSIRGEALWIDRDGKLYTEAETEADVAYAQSPSAPTFTLSNTGTIALASTESISGFTITNWTGGVLTGAGDFGTVVAEAGSILRPGPEAKLDDASPAVTMSAGALTMNQGSRLVVRALSLGSGVVSDSLSVTTAALNEATVRITGAPNARASWRKGDKVDVITASDGVTGTMKAETDLAFLRPSISVGEKKVTVAFDVNAVADLVPLLGSDNQRRAAAILVQAQEGTSAPAGDGATLVDLVNGLTKDTVAPALEQLSGSSATGGQTAALSGSGLFSSNVITQTLVAGGLASGGAPSTGGSNAPAYAGNEPFQTAALKAATPKDAKEEAAPPAPAASTWRLWATGLGAQSTTDARAASPRITGNDWGLAAGFDYVLDPQLIAGVSMGGTSSRFSVGGGATTGTTEGLHTSLYGIATFDELYVAGSLGYGRLETRARRTVSAFGSPERYAGKYATDAFTGQVELGYRVAWEAFTITPFAGLQATLMRQHAYAESTETVGGVAALAFKAQDTWSVPGQLGLQVERGFSLDRGWMLTAQARAAWVHEFSPERQARPSFAALPGSSFTVDGIAPVEDYARLTGGVTLANDNGTSLFASLTSNLSSASRTYAVQGGLKVEW